MRQRYGCNNCSSSFATKSKYTFSRLLIERLVKQHVSGKSSYRDLARDHLSKEKICQWVYEYGQNCKTTIEVAKELKPRWSGYLTADGKVIKVSKRKSCLLVGVDNTGDIVHTHFIDAPENKTGWDRFFRELRDNIHYPLKGLTSDGNPDILATSKRYLTNFRYQICTKHAQERIDRTFGYKMVIREKREKDYLREIELRNILRALLNAPDYNEFLEGFHYLRRIRKKFNSPICQNLLKYLDDNLHSFISHYFDPKIPRTNNLAENVIRQYNRRLKLIEGFRFTRTAEAYLRLLTMYLRFRKHTDAKKGNRFKNGKSKLEIAKANISTTTDWLKYSQRTY